MCQKLSKVRVAVELMSCTAWQPQLPKSAHNSRLCRDQLRCRKITCCSFKLYAIVQANQPKTKVQRLNPLHTGIGEPPPNDMERSKLAFLMVEVPKLIDVNPETSSREIQSLIHKHLGVEVDLHQVRRTKRVLLCDDEETARDDFTKIPVYLERLKAANPEVVTDLKLDSKGQFQRTFICPEESEAFMMGALPWLGIDGTRMENGYNQILLLAMGRDANNESMLLAWAVVESENHESWAWFVRLLKKTLPTICSETEQVTVIRYVEVSLH